MARPRGRYSGDSVPRYAAGLECGVGRRAVGVYPWNEGRASRGRRRDHRDQLQTAIVAAADSVSAAGKVTPSHRATTAVARQLPSRFTDVRAMSISASTPSSSATPSTGRLKVARVPARITRDARGTAATPLLVSISVNIMVICVPKERWIPAACATNIEASERYSVEPSRLKLYPVGSTNAAICLGTPKLCMFSRARGSAASLEAVE